jgi:hypothetical protein
MLPAEAARPSRPSRRIFDELYAKGFGDENIGAASKAYTA